MYSQPVHSSMSCIHCLLDSGSARRRIVSDAWLAARRDEHARTCWMLDVRELLESERGEREEMCVWEFWESWCTVVNKCTERYIPCWWKLTVYYVTWSDSSEHTIPNTLFRSVTHSLWTLVWLVRDCNGIKTYDRNFVTRQLFKDLYWHYAYIFIHLYIPQLRFVNCFFTVLMNEWMNELNQHPPPSPPQLSPHINSQCTNFVLFDVALCSTCKING